MLKHSTFKCFGSVTPLSTLPGITDESKPAILMVKPLFFAIQSLIETLWSSFTTALAFICIVAPLPHAVAYQNSYCHIEIIVEVLRSPFLSCNIYVKETLSLDTWSSSSKGLVICTFEAFLGDNTLPFIWYLHLSSLSMEVGTPKWWFDYGKTLFNHHNISLWSLVCRSWRDLSLGKQPQSSLILGDLFSLISFVSFASLLAFNNLLLHRNTFSP